MNKELELLRFIETHLQQNQRVVLMVVVQSSGSSPGRQGFKMAVAEDGTLFGSIGGGIMEVSFVELAKSQVSSLKSQVVEQIHQKNIPNSSGMICSGKQTVIYYQLTFKDLKTIRKIIQRTKNNPLDRYLTITSNSFELSWKKRFDVES